MDSIRMRKAEKEKTMRNISKSRIRGYRKDLEIEEKIRMELEEIETKMEGLSAVALDNDPVQGGGSSQEDRLVKLSDRKRDLSRELLVIELENRALIEAIEGIDDSEAKEIVVKVWLREEESMRSIASKLKLSTSSVWRKSDRALCEIYEHLYHDL